MKLAEALAERADIQTRVQQIRDRLIRNAKVQEGEQPAEEPNDLLKEIDLLITRLEELIYHINETNSKTLCEGKSLTELLAKRDCLSLKVRILRSFLNEASDLVSRGYTTDIKIKSTISVVKKQKELDKLSQELRKLDMQIQQCNWTTDLL